MLSRQERSGNVRADDRQHADARIDRTFLAGDRSQRPHAIHPPPFVTDDIARQEWERVAATLHAEGLFSPARHSLLAGYCNAVARAVRAEEILASEGRYYQTLSTHGSIMRRRHPAAQDAEDAWTAVRQFARQLGIAGGFLGESEETDARRSIFK